MAGKKAEKTVKELMEAAYQRHLEVAVNRDLLDLKGMTRFTVGAALWHGGLPIDVLPAEGFFDVQLGEEHSAWPVDL